MTDRIKKRRRLSSEILATFGICFVISLALFGILLHLSVGIVQSYCFDHDIYLDEEQLYRLDSTALGGSLACAAVCFCTLFFVLFGKRLSYVRTLTDGKLTLIDPGAEAAKCLAEQQLADGSKAESGRKGSLKLYVSDTDDGFAERARSFLDMDVTGLCQQVDIDRY